MLYLPSVFTYILYFQVSFEKESLKREVAELSDRVILLEKSSRQLEIDNERLSFKVRCLHIIIIHTIYIIYTLVLY